MFNKKSFVKNPNYSKPVEKVEIIEVEELPKIEDIKIEEPSIKPKRKYVKKNKTA
jgi:hypothetical protein